MIKPLTIKQKEVLEAIQYLINKQGYSPTYREIADLLGKKTHVVFEQTMILEEKGYVSTVNGKSRTIKVLKDAEC